MTTSWITDPSGRYVALVEDGDQLNTWLLVHGWQRAAEPQPNSEVQTYIAKPVDGLRGCIPFVALDSWRAEGWEPGPPPEPVDTTKDPVTPEPPAEAAKPKTPAAAGGSKSKE